LNHKEIREEAARVLDALPKQFRDRLKNIQVVVEQRPGKNRLRAMGLNPRIHTLYGIYEGTALPDRSVFAPPALPDKITIFSEPLRTDFPDPDELREQIRLTVLHEIAHYFGMDEDDIEKLGY
jgi:predicted Zn-dependent protease with MMP-like domain